MSLKIIFLKNQYLEYHEGEIQDNMILELNIQILR